MADARPTLSTHVLDLASGSPAAGVGVASFAWPTARRS